MPVLLHIDSSARTEQSISRKLSAEFVARWREVHTSTQLIYRDLGKSAIPIVTDEWITAVYTPVEQRTRHQNDVLAVSDKLLDELFAADVIVLGVPMYNFNIPANLKAYIDQIVRTGKTFTYASGRLEGLAKGKKLFVIQSRGSDFSAGTPMEALNHQTPYLKTIFNFIGISDITFIEANGQSVSSIAPEKLASAQSQIQQWAV
jgi:FMN-dependent NADH-azoreductase